jgi:hypothetical protein
MALRYWYNLLFLIAIMLRLFFQQFNRTWLYVGIFNINRAFMHRLIHSFCEQLMKHLINNRLGQLSNLCMNVKQVSPVFHVGQRVVA